MKTLSVLLAGLLTTLAATAQLEVGILVGAANYTGDLSNNSASLYWNETQLGAGAFARYNLSPLLTLRGSFNYAAVSGDDANSDAAAIRARNLSFRSNLFELTATAEVNLPGFDPYNFNQPVSPYLFAGIGGVYLNPTTELDGERVALQPLGTEGQGLSIDEQPIVAKYNQVQFVVPFGLGLKVAVAENINLGLEVGARFLLSDYLDDVSGTYVSAADLSEAPDPLTVVLSDRSDIKPEDRRTGDPRGDAAPRDWYYLAGLTVSYNFLDTGLVRGRQRSRQKQGCRIW